MQSILAPANFIYLLKSRTFAPRRISSDGVMIIGLIFLALILLLIGKKIISLVEAVDNENANCEHIKKVCRERGIGESEIKELLTVIKACRLRHSHRLISSLELFDQIIYDKLSTLIGSARSTEVRRRFFLSPVKKSVSKAFNNRKQVRIPGPQTLVRSESSMVGNATDIILPPDNTLEDIFADFEDTGTRTLMPGQEVKLQFANMQEMLPCGVMLVEKDNFMVFLPAAKNSSIQLGVGDHVEGYYYCEDSYFYFESQVVKVFQGEVISCRISHAEKLQEIQRREYSRATLNYPFQFYHITACEVEQAESPENGLKNAKKVIRQGILRDISAGGCALETADEGQPVNPADFLRFPIALPDAENPVRVMGAVLKVDYLHKPEGMMVYVHVQFLGISEHLRDRLVKAVYQMMKSGKNNRR